MSSCYEDCQAPGFFIAGYPTFLLTTEEESIPCSQPAIRARTPQEIYSVMVDRRILYNVTLNQRDRNFLRGRSPVLQGNHRLIDLLISLPLHPLTHRHRSRKVHDGSTYTGSDRSRYAPPPRSPASLLDGT